jgi:hypothetical protein
MKFLKSRTKRLRPRKRENRHTSDLLFRKISFLVSMKPEVLNSESQLVFIKNSLGFCEVFGTPLQKLFEFLLRMKF